MSERKRKNQPALAQPRNRAAAKTVRAENGARSSGHNQAAPNAKNRTKNKRRSAASVPLVAQRRTRKFLRHYWQLFNFARQHVGTGRLVQVALLAVTATAAQGGILFLAAAFASLMESGGKELEAYGLNGLATNALAALFAFSIPALLLLLYASLASYWASKLMRKYGRITQLQLTRRVLRNMAWLHRVDLSDVVPNSGSFKRLFARDLKQSGKAVEKMLRLIQPSVYLVLGLATIFYLEPILSMAVLAAGSVMVPLLYLQSRFIQENAINYFRRHTTDYGKTLATLSTKLLSASPGQSSQVEEDWLEKKPEFTAFLDAYDKLRLAPKYMALRASILRSIFVVCGVLAIGWLAIESQRSWGVLVLYVGALLFFAAGLQAFLQILAILIKYYPQTQTLTTVIERLEAASTAAPQIAEIPDVMTLTARSRFEGSDRRRQISHRDLTALYAAVPLDRLTFQAFLQPMRRASNAPPELWDTATFLTALPPAPNSRLGTAVLGTEKLEAQRAWLDTFLNEALQSSFQESFPEGLETELTEELWNALAPRARAACALATTCADTCGVLIVADSVATKLPVSFLRNMPATHKSPYLFIVSSDLDLTLEADHYVVADEKTVIGLGDRDWLQARRDEIEPLLNVKRNGGTFLDDDDDDF